MLASRNSLLHELTVARAIKQINGLQGSFSSHSIAAKRRQSYAAGSAGALVLTPNFAFADSSNAVVSSFAGCGLLGLVVKPKVPRSLTQLSREAFKHRKGLVVNIHHKEIALVELIRVTAELCSRIPDCPNVLKYLSAGLRGLLDRGSNLVLLSK